MLEAVLPLSPSVSSDAGLGHTAPFKVKRKTCTNVVVLVSFLFFYIVVVCLFVFVCLFVGRFRPSFLFLECQTSLWTVH